MTKTDTQLFQDVRTLLVDASISIDIDGSPYTVPVKASFPKKGGINNAAIIVQSSEDTETFNKFGSVDGRFETTVPVQVYATLGQWKDEVVRDVKDVIKNNKVENLTLQSIDKANALPTNNDEQLFLSTLSLNYVNG